MILALANPIESAFANPCELETCKLKACEKRETRNCKSLRNIAKRCKTIPANLRESLRKPAKSNLRKLAKPKYLRQHICESLRKYIRFALANPCENTICEILRKVYLLHPHPGSCPVAELVILYVFTLFVITILEPIVSAGFLSFVCPKCFTIHVCQPTYEEIQLLSCFKSIRSCVIYLT